MPARFFSTTRSVLSKVKLFHHNQPIKLHLTNAGNRIVSLTDYMKETCPSLLGPKAVYTPTSFLYNGHLQTIYSAYYNSAPTTKPVKYEREYVDTPDGGQIALDWSPAINHLKKGDVPTLVVLHGLTGGSHESYVRCLLEVLTYPPFNYRAVVINCRGCANSVIKTPQMYNGAYTKDVRHVMKHIQERLAPNTLLVGIGFSLGSNILVKYLGEEKEKAPFKAAISVANPFDFKRSMNHLNETFIGRNIYSFAMARNLKKVFSRHMNILKKSGKIDPKEIMSATSIREFDNACTRKMFDYASVDQYYDDASSFRFIKDVQVPLLCLNALDDPIANPACIPYKEIEANPNVVLATTEEGGHLGWFENTNNPTRWMIKPLSEFIIAMFQAFDVRRVQGQKLDASSIDAQVESIQSRSRPHEIA